jgi:hypothetical protein
MKDAMKIEIAYSFTNLRNRWSRVDDGVMPFRSIPGRTRLKMKAAWRSPVTVLAQNYQYEPFVLDTPLYLTKGQYFKWDHLN